MERLLLLLCVTFSVLSAHEAAKSGLIELDEHSFDKILSKFDAALVKFDVAYPYGDKHDAFLGLAKEAREVDDLLVADVNVKDYGEKENEALAAKYGATKDNFPVVKLFVKGKKDPIPFEDSKGFTTESLRNFVTEKTGLRMVLPGCVRQLDVLAEKFMKASSKDKKNVLKDLESAEKDLDKRHSASAKVYKTIMKKVIEKGDEFIKTEQERVKKILSGKVTEEKKKELNTRVNILQSFATEKSKSKEDL